LLHKGAARARKRWGWGLTFLELDLEDEMAAVVKCLAVCLSVKCLIQTLSERRRCLIQTLTD
jgi:hypothetical protein